MDKYGTNPFLQCQLFCQLLGPGCSKSKLRTKSLVEDSLNLAEVTKINAVMFLLKQCPQELLKGFCYPGKQTKFSPFAKMAENHRRLPIHLQFLLQRDTIITAGDYLNCMSYWYLRYLINIKNTSFADKTISSSFEKTNNLLIYLEAV